MGGGGWKSLGRGECRNAGKPLRFAGVQRAQVCGSSVQASGRKDMYMCTLMGWSHKQTMRGQACV